MMSLNMTCGGCKKTYGVHIGPMSSLNTKRLLESLANIEDRHADCLQADPNMRTLYPNHPAIA